MKVQTIQRTIKTVCGKTISYLQTTGETAKAHSTTGPAIIYPDNEGISPEYYLYGVKYTKAKWREVLTQHKAVVTTELFMLES